MAKMDYQDKQHLRSATRGMPPKMKSKVEAGYHKKTKEISRREANLFVLGVIERLAVAGFRVSMSDDDVCDWAEVRSRGATVCISRGGCISKYCAGFGVEPPDFELHDSVCARVTDAAWWRRRGRVVLGRAIESLSSALGIVNKAGDIYVSTDSKDRVEQQARRNRTTLESVVMVNDEGVEYTLAELSDLSVSNPAIRRCELLTRMAGFEAIARERGDYADFYTITCPSKFHSHIATKSGAVENKKYNGSTPRDGAKYLQSVWARIRAQLAREGITIYGFRVAEPHHDGCPHWHLSIFGSMEEREKAREIIKHYAAKEDNHELKLGAEARVKVIDINSVGGSATAYIIKYISKNIDGNGMGDSEKSLSQRVKAWASTWGIRQFQQIGGPSVTVWRELRRLHGCCVSDNDEVIGLAAEAATKGDWAEYIRVVNGLAERGLHEVKLLTMQDIDRETGELPVNKYGEEAAGAILGVYSSIEIEVTRWIKWKVKESGNSKDKEKWGEVERISRCCKTVLSGS